MLAIRNKEIETLRRISPQETESDEETAERIASVGLPENKYDAAAISLAVLQNAKSEEEKFVDRFLWDIDGDNF